VARKYLAQRRDLLRSRRYEGSGKDDIALRRIKDRSVGVQATLVTVAFNAPELVAIQIEALREQFADSFVHVIVDNSSRPDARRAIRALCARTDVEYVPLPPSHATSGSQSHGLALNWATANILRSSAADYAGFLDHDIFPFAPCSYGEVISRQGSYGHFQHTSNSHFYWPGLMFFAPEFLATGSYDFQPRWVGRHYGDTGAGNWPAFYARLDLDALRVMSIEDFHATDPSRPYVKHATPLAFQSEALTILDGSWVHLINGSNWAGDSRQDAKLVALRDFLQSKTQARDIGR
jgi:hypothetical protein